MTIFEKIVAREIPALIIYENNDIISFMDLYPVSKGHVLVCPKVGYKDIFEIPSDILAKLIKVTKMLAEVIKKTFNCDGINLVNNNGAAASQAVFHYHMHIIPRYLNDKVEIIFPHNEISEEIRKSWAEEIKKGL